MSGSNGPRHFTAGSYLYGLVAFWLAGCSTLQTNPKSDLEARAKQHHFQIRNHSTSQSLTLLSAARLHSEALTFYIEGDGSAWLAPEMPPEDPTPDQQLVFTLASLDSGSPVYLARPCQYLTPEQLAQCSPRYWIQDKYAPAVVAALSEAIDQIKQQAGTRSPITLVGYSGGGVIAMLLSSYRSDIKKIITIAAPLDLEYWADLMTVSRFSVTNPATLVKQQEHTLAQMHLAGWQDTTVPAKSYERLLQSLERQDLIRFYPHSHHCCWEAVWQQTLETGL